MIYFVYWISGMNGISKLITTIIILTSVCVYIGLQIINKIINNVSSRVVDSEKLRRWE